MAGLLVLLHRVQQTEDAITYNSALRARGPWRDAQFFLDELARNGLALALPLAWLFLLVTPSKSGGFGVSSSEDIIACNTVLEGDRIGLKWHAVCLLLEKMNIAALCLQWSVPCAQVSCLKSFNVVRRSACYHGVLAWLQEVKATAITFNILLPCRLAENICLGATNSSTCGLWAEAWDSRSKSPPCIAHKQKWSVK